MGEQEVADSLRLGEGVGEAGAGLIVQHYGSIRKKKVRNVNYWFPWSCRVVPIVGGRWIVWRLLVCISILTVLCAVLARQDERLSFYRPQFLADTVRLERL